MKKTICCMTFLLAAGAAVGIASPISAAPAAEAKTKIQSFKVKAAQKTLYLGWKKAKKSTTIKVKVKPKKASKAAVFRSSNKKVATVSKTGKVTAVKAGKTTITVTSKGNKKCRKKVNITVKNYPMSFAKKTVSMTLEGTKDVTDKKMTLYGTDTGVTFYSSNTDVATVTKKGTVKAKKFGQTVITAKNKKGKKVTCTLTVKNASLAVHDPSVYRDPQSGKYYTFGSHLTAAVSTNLIGWSYTAKSSTNYSSSSTLFTKNYKKEFAKAYAYTMPSGANQNAWAPDIIYNTAMKKYCMYISIVDGSTKCCIAMATSDQPDGPYAYQDMIVCSGMEQDGSDIDKTNVASALGMTAAEAKASKYASLGTNSPDCIDATVFYDHKGNLWMVYGSFTTTGGIRLLKLDKTTGLRGENYNDSGDGTDSTLSTDDPYYGKKIANSNGEGPYIQMIANENSSSGYYYYLFTSVGNLQYYGGYNMRIVRAENPEGPYYDTQGNEATADLQKYALGLRIMDNYQFSFMSEAFVSQGGNSAIDDGNGKTFIQFHTRTSGSDSYSLRTHQTFVNEDGWLVTAPFEYNGETIADSYDKSAVVGDYEFLYHRSTFAKTTIANKDILTSKRLTLNEDGTVSGAYTGTWSLNGHNVTISINNETYKGVVLEQYEQTDKREKVMVFTAVGSDNRAIWGSKTDKSDAELAVHDTEKSTVTVSETLAAEYAKAQAKTITMLQNMSDVLYDEDYSTMVSDAAIATRWTSKDKQNCLYVEADATHDSFIKFAAGNTSSSQGAQTLFGIADTVKDRYAVKFDVALEAGSSDTSEFALMGTDVKFKNDDTNAGLESGYILKLQAKNSTKWSVNGSEQTFELPITWVTVTAVVDTTAKTADVVIADDDMVYYAGQVKINGTGKPNGLYLRWAYKQSLVSVDNVKVLQ
jgi:arabinan endo-1,5-alpha-L-arabinosidase